MKAVFTLSHSTARKRAMAAVADAPEGFCVTVAEPTRNLEQNAKLWAMLAEISAQVVWHGKKLSPESWKAVFSSALRKLDVVPNLDGTGFVALGQSTSQMSKREFGELIELIAAFAAERGVSIQEPVYE
jgi:hypothetical protein